MFAVACARVRDEDKLEARTIEGGSGRRAAAGFRLAATHARRATFLFISHHLLPLFLSKSGATQT